MSWSALVDQTTRKFYPDLIPEGGGIPLTKGQLITANAAGTLYPYGFEPPPPPPPAPAIMAMGRYKKMSYEQCQDANCIPEKVMKKELDPCMIASYSNYNSLRENNPISQAITFHYLPLISGLPLEHSKMLL
jgi:hypothetical protein